MTICVDALAAYWNGPDLRMKLWSHLLTDNVDDLEELHKFAESIGLERTWFQDVPGGTPHYDVTAGKRLHAVNAGAQEIERDRVVEIIYKWRDKRRKVGA